MHIFTFAEKDTTLYEVSGSMNSGLDEILEIRKDISDTGDSINVSRILIKFDLNSKDFLKSLKMPCSKCHLIGHNRRTCPCIIEGITRIRRNVNGEIYGQKGS